MKIPQAVIIMLLVANLVATVWFGLKGGSTNEQSAAEKAAVHELPSSVSEAVRDRIFSEIVSGFNAADSVALYNLFSPAAKTQMSEEQSKTEFDRLVQHFHSIEDGAFSHSEFAGAKGSTRFFILNYVVKLSPESTFGTKGTLKVTLAVQGSNFEIYGIRINAGTDA